MPKPINSAMAINIFPPDGKPFGLSYQQHGINYWKWLLAMPVNESPDNDKTGERCSNGQTNSNSSVFYLTGGGGGQVERICEIPKGKGVLIMLSSVEMSDKEVKPGTSLQELTEIAKADQDGVKSLNLKIDDKEYTYSDLIKYRTTTGPFDIVFPKNALFGVTPGPSKVVSDNTFVITEPIQSGNHTVQIKGSACSEENCDALYAYNVKYNLIIK